MQLREDIVLSPIPTANPNNANAFNKYNQGTVFQAGDRVRFVNPHTGEISSNEGIFQWYFEDGLCSVSYCYGDFNVNRVVDIFKAR